ncbi:hypothetical protein Tco_1263467 [Tanacetum coccineum]
MIFGDDETIATLLLNMNQAKAASKGKRKGLEVEIDPKGTKGKKKIKVGGWNLKSEMMIFLQAVKNSNRLKSDGQSWQGSQKRNGKIEAEEFFAEKIQEKEREQFTIEEREKDDDYLKLCGELQTFEIKSKKFEEIQACMKDLKRNLKKKSRKEDKGDQRSQALRNKPPTKNQLRNQMMTYIKHVGNYKHADLKSKKFEDIQALYEKIKRFNEDFISTRSAQDERFIKRMNEKGAGLSKSEVIKKETKQEVKIEDKEEESTRKRKLGTRKKMKSRKRRYIQNTSEDNNEKEDDELKLYLSIVQDEEKEFDESKEEEINLNVVTRSNGQQRYFSILTTVLSIFDREDLNAVFQLVMDKYHDEMPEGFERVLWGDLMVLFNPDEQDEFWSSQHEWKVINWKLHSSSGVHTLMTNEGVVIHMLTEKKYPLKKEIVVQMLNLKLESEEESTMALELIRFIKKVLADLESEEQG